ncbi:PKD domain-containing protein [Pseudarthrobacter enclensis]|uniref:PKD repeat protein n=1 Tax=Pseudarthrobacter enclensis TaxID=993070 RepID=A0ABT9RSX8_9MICC|nr:PKD domain-containing protein [Pseudarthrobacter enclensis]MDP9888351.1 PKD repeat protein [Pseudarthrobacter enclensis]
MKIAAIPGRLRQALVLALIAALAPLGWAPAASADPVYGRQSISYSGVANPPTSDKPQSKLWWNDGSWWADMWTSGSGWSIYRLDRPTATWVNTGVVNDSRSSTLADTMWDGSHLYIASHVVTVSTDASPKDSVSGQPAYLYRYSYSGGKYTLDAGFPTVITNNSSESMTIDEDSTGAIWSTWTQVSGNSTSGYTNTVYVNDSAAGGTSWATPFVIPVSNPHPAPDDISAVVSFAKNKIGVMWSDQLTGSVWWATRTDGTSPTASSSWNFQPAIQGKGQADDHMNLKSLQSDTTGRVFAAVKTSLNDISSDTTLPQLLLLVFKPGTGAFTQSTISTVGDCVSRPQIVLDTTNNLVHAFQTAPATSVSSCAYSGVAGSIYEKTASMDNPSFGSGRGTPVIQSASSSNMNDVTTTKQGVNSSTGIVVMASDNVAKTYWYSDRSLGTATTAPVASFTASPTSGTAPLNVNFTDTSTGSPTSWAWDFGDGGTSTAQNPSHSYAAAGTYTAKLTATNSAGSSSANTTITVGTATTTSGISAVGSSTTYSGTAVTGVSISAPAGTAAGDVLVAAITVDTNPGMASVPAGWTAMVNGLSINSSSTSGARVYVYYHVVGSSDPASYAWTLSAAAKWGGGITGYRGVNNTTPLDAQVVTAVDASYSATSITAPSTTTATNGAMVIGGVGCDCASPMVSAPPSGWTQQWQAAGGQIAELADKVQATAGATGTATWTLSAQRAVAAWQAALKPAG